MNLSLTDEQLLLVDAARGTLARHQTVAAARAALEGSSLPDLWPVAREAGWPGLLVDESHGGAGLELFDAILVLGQCGRVLAGVPLLGHLPATDLLDAVPDEVPGGLESLASGERRAALVPACPPDEMRLQWTVDARSGSERELAPLAVVDGARVKVTGTVAWVPDAPGADVLVVIAREENETPVAVAIEASAAGVSVEPVRRFDATRSLGQVVLDGAEGVRLSVDAEQIARSWFVAQALLASESVGAVETALDVTVQYAKDRFTFGRAIGSYQAVKHQLTEMLRLLENGRSLLYYAGWAGESGPGELALAASAARSAAGRALEFSSRSMIGLHGGIGATWEHDAPLYFRRAQLSRRLLGGTDGASDRVAEELLRAADLATA